MDCVYGLIQSKFENLKLRALSNIKARHLVLPAEMEFFWCLNWNEKIHLQLKKSKSLLKNIQNIK